jgi:DNA-binding GntR family transcriptional regulator
MESVFPQIGSDHAAAPPRTSNLRAIPRVSLKEAAVQQICQAIESGELKSGEVLTELGLASKLGVAQPTIREALLELEFIGYIERTVGRKARVTLLTRRSIENIYLVRTRLETLAVELIASQPSPQLEACKKTLDAMESAARNGVFREFCHADLKFHRALWSSSQNDCIQSSLERIVPKLFAFAIIRHSNPSITQLIETYELHRRLMEAILQRNAVHARQLMELSMEQAWLDDAQLPAEDGL